MKWTILGSGGCMVIPKPLCRCRVCREARKKGIPYARTGPSAFLHDINLLIDTPAEIISQLNRSRIRRLDYLMLTHLDPDHVEGIRVVEQLSLDFRTWRAFPEKRICLLLPEQLVQPLRNLSSQYGSIIDYYQKQGFVDIMLFDNEITIDSCNIKAIPVDRGSQLSFVLVFEKDGRRVIYAPCDIKPFPENNPEVQNPDIMIIQPGIMEGRLKKGFHYPEDHISRTTLYTFEATLALANRINACKVVFTHLEEYWNRSHDDYSALARKYHGIRFSFDGMKIKV